ncbi:MAG: FAD-binding oxidoreductase [Thermodesulfobacteriota bacterium]
MTQTADVVIIGGGVMGCALAYNLARQGLKALVIEKSDIGGEASGSNGGGVRQSARNAKELPLAMASVRIFGQLHEELGRDVEYVRQGNLRLCTSAEEIEAMRKSVAGQKALGLELELLDRKQVLEMNPYVSEKVQAATFCPTDGHANPLLTTYAFYLRARELGAEFLTHEEAGAIKLRKGRVAAVVTDRRTIETDTLVNAAGLGGRRIANLVGLDLPMKPTFTEALITEPYPPLFPQMIGHAKGLFYGRQTKHGSFFWGGMAGTEQYIYQEGKPLFHFIGPAISRMVLDFFPVLGGLNVIRTWSGLIEGMSDGLPVLGFTEEVPGFIFCAGFSGHGFGLAPAIGRIMAELILDCRASIPIHEFCYARFNKGRDADCACQAEPTCALHTALCPNKKEHLKNL